MPKLVTLPTFSPDEAKKAKLLLATQVATMMGRKLEEGDWSRVYCRAKGIPEAGWSNLYIDVDYNGLGVEHKLLRCPNLNGRSIKTVCGTTLMHPAATRSIRIDDINAPAEDVMVEVFNQYADLIRSRTERVRQRSGSKDPDMRLGWLLWEDTLSEFIYFEEAMKPPNPAEYYAVWNETSVRGVRKSSKSLWVYERGTNKKRYSVTTSAGIKIQPYFDVPSPSDTNMFYARVQSERIDSDTVLMWIAASTAYALKERLGSTDKSTISAAIIKLVEDGVSPLAPANPEDDLAVPIEVSAEAHEKLLNAWEAVSDEHRAQLLLKALS